MPFCEALAYKRSTGVRTMRSFQGSGLPYQPMKKTLAWASGFGRQSLGRSLHTPPQGTVGGHQPPLGLPSGSSLTPHPRVRSVSPEGR